MKLSVSLLFVSLCGFAQTPAPPVASVATEWDVRSQMKNLGDHTRKFVPLLADLKVNEWVKEGASPEYVKQLASAQAELQNVTVAADKVVRDPEKLSSALDAYFRLQSMEALVMSLRDATLKYQDAALASKITRLLADDSNLLAKLQRHIEDLASTREQEFQIMNQEAQRCRTEILRQGGQEADTQSRRRSKR